MGFGVEGAIEGEIILRGIAPGLGLNLQGRNDLLR